MVSAYHALEEMETLRESRERSVAVNTFVRAQSTPMVDPYAVRSDSRVPLP